VTLGAADGAPPLFQKLSVKRTYVRLVEQIREKIFSEKLRLFERLPSERELAEQFGVSRVAVREAIRTLESSGLLIVKKGPKGGIFVAQDYERPVVDVITNLLSAREMSLENLFEVRLLTEPYAAARVAEIGSDAEFDALEAKIADAEREHKADESVRHHYIDFHRHVLRLTRNPLLSIVGESVLLVIYDRAKRVISAETSGMGLTMHRQLLRAFRDRRPEKARSIMAKDIELLSTRFVQLSKPAPRASKPKPKRASASA